MTGWRQAQLAPRQESVAHDELRTAPAAACAASARRPAGTPTRSAATRCATSTAASGPSTCPPTAGPVVDPPVGQGHVPTVAARAGEGAARRAARRARPGVAAFQGGGSIFTEPVLVVNQKAKLIEINNEYAIYDQNAQQIGRGARGRAEQR